MVFDSALNFIFSPLLKIPILIAVLFVSFAISVIVTVIYKYTTDQNLMKQLKEEMKAFQKQIKELRSDPQKAMEVQKKAMQTNMNYMMQSFKSTLYSFIPIILIFGWMNSHFAFIPIMPGQEFTTVVNFQPNAQGTISISVPSGLELKSESSKAIENNQAKWLLQGKEGEYLIEYAIDGKKYSHEVLISELYYKAPISKIKKDPMVRDIQTELQKKIVLNLFGWKIGWLGSYILFAIGFSMLLRKLMKVY